jgi:uncharacterized protein YcfJ
MMMQFTLNWDYQYYGSKKEMLTAALAVCGGYAGPPPQKLNVQRTQLIVPAEINCAQTSSSSPLKLIAHKPAHRPR